MQPRDKNAEWEFLWVHQWRRRHARCRVSIVRYAGDFVMGFESAVDPKRTHSGVIRADSDLIRGPVLIIATNAAGKSTALFDAVLESTVLRGSSAQTYVRLAPSEHWRPTPEAGGNSVPLRSLCGWKVWTPGIAGVLAQPVGVRSMDRGEHAAAAPSRYRCGTLPGAFRALRQGEAIRARRVIVERDQ